MSLNEPTIQIQGDSTPAPLSTGALFVLAIGVGAVVGLTVQGADRVFSAGIDTTLQFLVFLLFFELRPEAVAKSFANLRFLSLAWCANFLIVPLIAFGIASLLAPGQSWLFLGLMIYFLAPCTDWFLGFTRLAKGDTELGTALIPINIVTQLVLFPVWLWLFGQGTGFVNFQEMPSLLMNWFLIPLCAAQAARLGVQAVLRLISAEHCLDYISKAVPFVLAALILQIFGTHIGVITERFEVFALIALAVSLFLVANFLVGEALARFFRLAYPQHTLLAMSLAARNAPLMLALTAVAIPDQPLILAVIVSGMLVEMPLLTLLKQMMLRRRSKTN